MERDFQYGLSNSDWVWGFVYEYVKEKTLIIPIEDLHTMPYATLFVRKNVICLPFFSTENILHYVQDMKNNKDMDYKFKEIKDAFLKFNLCLQIKQNNILLISKKVKIYREPILKAFEKEI